VPNQEALFLKKRSKKLSPIEVDAQLHGKAMDKVFLLLFFQKKKRFLSCPQQPRAR
jgi:hypothetical protein